MDIIKLDPKLMRGKKPTVSLVDGWIAGGAVRAYFNGEKTSDIDIFSTSQEKMLENIKSINTSNSDKIYETKTNITFNINGKVIQFMKLYHPNLESLFDSFDFTLCQFAMDKDGNIFSTVESVTSVLRGHLSVHKIQEGFQLDSLRRAFKYYDKGYRPCLGSISDMAKSFSSMSEEQVRNQTVMSPGGKIRNFIKFD